MGAVFTSLRQMRGVGIFADRSANSPSVDFRRYNLVYGFNGSGKSTLSRIFASLEAGALHPKLPQEGSFNIELDDSTNFGCPHRPAGLERRMLVFNSDFIDRNLKWSDARANPVFYIGSDQAEAAAELAKLEATIEVTAPRLGPAENAVRAAERALVQFKREKAKITASRLHLGNRKYEAPQLTADFQAWQADTVPPLDDAQLMAAEEIRKSAEPMPALAGVEFDCTKIGRARLHVEEICTQSLADVALKEIQSFPDMLIWMKQGHEFHTREALDHCLFCGNSFTPERKALLDGAFNNLVDEFVEKLARTADRLEAVIGDVAALDELAAGTDAVSVDIRARYDDARKALSKAVGYCRSHLRALADVLTSKREKPATAADVSGLALQADVEADADRLAQALSLLNEILAEHNRIVADFTQHRDNAGVAIRRHFIGLARTEFSDREKSFAKARQERDEIDSKLQIARDGAAELRRRIQTHGPAAEAINKLIASYLGHREIAIAAVDEGYEIHRHGRAIQGMPSEGEKTAIAICYFLSMLEAEGRKLKDMIVVIDDPVSSLDSRALNFACSLVRSRLENASQLFILTHNQQCMNEFKKAWKNRIKDVPASGANPAKSATAKFLFIDVVAPEGTDKRRSSLVEMSQLLREYDSEYHFLFDHVIRFAEAGDEHFDHGYMMPNVLRRVLDIFLAFKCPGNSGLPGKIAQLCAIHKELDRDRLVALERLTQVESHSDNLDDLISFSSMTLEETREATASLLTMMKIVDEPHLKGLKRICGRAQA